MFRTKDLLKERLEKVYEEHREFDNFVYSLALTLVGGSGGLFIILGIITAITGNGFTGALAIGCIIVAFFGGLTCLVIGGIIGLVYDNKEDRLKEMFFDVIRIEEG